MKNELPPYFSHPSTPGRDQAIQSYFEGTYQSNWNFLVQATRSSLLHAAIGTEKTIKSYLRQIPQNEGETYYLISHKYAQSLAGPLLGTIVAAAAALETFMRLVAQAISVKELPKSQRSRGTPAQVARALDEFDRLPTFADPPRLSRVDDLFERVLERECRKAVRDELGHLIAFRNDSLHGNPVLRRSDGTDETVRQKGHVRRVVQRHIPAYPHLWSSNRPLSLAHALRASRVHDAIVRELTAPAASEYLRQTLEIDDDPGAALVLTGVPKHLSVDRLDSLAKAWDIFEELVLSAVSDTNKRRYFLDTKRRAMLRLVK